MQSKSEGYLCYVHEHWCVTYIYNLKVELLLDVSFMDKFHNIYQPYHNFVLIFIGKIDSHYTLHYTAWFRHD